MSASQFIGHCTRRSSALIRLVSHLWLQFAIALSLSPQPQPQPQPQIILGSTATTVYALGMSALSAHWALARPTCSPTCTDSTSVPVAVPVHSSAPVSAGLSNGRGPAATSPPASPHRKVLRFDPSGKRGRPRTDRQVWPSEIKFHWFLMNFKSENKSENSI